MIVDCAVYQDGRRRAGELAVEDAHEAARDANAFVWIGQYFRDVYDHLARMASRVEGYRELLTNILTANLTQVSLGQNEDVRRISAWAAIIAVPTLISGVYGMNFDHMPELSWTFGYPAALTLMASVCLALYGYFRKVGWL